VPAGKHAFKSLHFNPFVNSTILGPAFLNIFADLDRNLAPFFLAALKTTFPAAPIPFHQIGIRHSNKPYKKEII
jgi:hypothetical protein